MRSTDILKMTFDRWKDDFMPFLLISVESFLIMLVAQLIFLPLGIAAYFSFFFIAIFIDSIGVVLVIFFIIMIYLVMFALGIIIAAFINPAVVNAVEKQFGGEEVSFGDVFNYGKAVWKDYIGLVALNMLVSLVFFGLVYGVIGGIIALLILFSPVAICFALVLVYPAAILISLILLPVQYLIFIIKYKEDASSWDCIRRAYTFVFRNFGFSFSLGLIVILVMMAVSIIPFVSIVISLFMMTFLHTAFLYVYYEMEV
jgi:hypothetical protein